MEVEGDAPGASLTGSTHDDRAQQAALNRNSPKEVRESSSETPKTAGCLQPEAMVVISGWVLSGFVRGVAA